MQRASRPLAYRPWLGAISVLAIVALATGPATSSAHALTARAGAADRLYIGDAADNTVKQYDARSGTSLGTLVAPSAAGLLGPKGLIIQDGQLVVSNQNVDTAVAGDILRFGLSTGQFSGAMVASTASHAPFAPQGIVLKGGKLFVANLQAGDNNADGTFPDGTVSVYKAADGSFQQNLPTPPILTGQFHPRAVVFGPDHLLYVSVRNLPDPCGGSVLRYDVSATNPALWAFHDVFITNASTCTANVNGLNRPQGLVFGPDGNLYVTSFRADSTDTDKILTFDPTGKLLGHIDLDQAGGPRTFAQALLFGPGGKLIVPISNTGEVRRYDVTTKTFDTFVSAGTSLSAPWFLTFGQTNPATLAYDQ